MSIIISVLVPVLVYLLLPPLLTKLTSRRIANRKLLAVAGVVFFVSWYLPSPDIQGEQTAAVTHFLGGGVYCGIVWIYIRQWLKQHIVWWIDLLGLLALVSLLGTVNELFELAAVNAGLLDMHLNDTSWDLLMNTLGALSVWMVYQTRRLLTRA